MKVILNADVANLGEEGDIKEVKNGYARNFIFPRKLGMPYNKANLAIIDAKKDAIEKRREEKRQAALSLKEKLEAAPLQIGMTTGRNGKLFGSVNAAMIVAELAKSGIEIEKKAVDIPDNSIKAVGNYKVGIKLYGGEVAQITVAVTSSAVEEEPQAPVAVAKESEKAESAEATEAAVGEDEEKNESQDSLDAE